MAALLRRGCRCEANDCGGGRDLFGPSVHFPTYPLHCASDSLHRAHYLAMATSSEKGIEHMADTEHTCEEITKICVLIAVFEKEFQQMPFVPPTQASKRLGQHEDGSHCVWRFYQGVGKCCITQNKCRTRPYNKKAKCCASGAFEVVDMMPLKKLSSRMFRIFWLSWREIRHVSYLVAFSTV